jgi:hypothetical protein
MNAAVRCKRGERLLVVVMVALGLGQMAAERARAQTLRGLLAATGAAPAPKVFTRVGALEPFSMGFRIAYDDAQGQRRRVVLDARRYARLRGAYNRRNVFGAVLAAGPALDEHPRTRSAAAAVRRAALCGERPLLRELGVDPGEVAGGLAIEYEARGRGLASPPPLRVHCP